MRSALYQQGAKALDAVSAGLVHRLAGSDIGGDLLLGKGAEGHRGDLVTGDYLLTTAEGEAGVDLVADPGEGGQHPKGVQMVGGLAQNGILHRHHCVGGQNEGVGVAQLVGGGGRLPLGEGFYQLGGDLQGHGVFVKIRDQHPEVPDAHGLQKLFPAGRAGGENDVHSVLLDVVVGEESLLARASESAHAPFGTVQLLYLHRLDLDHGHNGQLGDALPGLDGIGLAPQMDQPHLDLPAVVAIDDAHSVGEGEPLLHGQAAPGKDQAHVLGGQGDGDAGGHQGPLAGRKSERLVQAGGQVHPGGAGGGVAGQDGVGVGPFHIHLHKEGFLCSGDAPGALIAMFGVFAIRGVTLRLARGRVDKCALRRKCRSA